MMLQDVADLIIAILAVSIILMYVLEYPCRKVRFLIAGFNYLLHIAMLLMLMYLRVRLEYVLLFLLASLAVMLTRRKEITDGI